MPGLHRSLPLLALAATLACTGRRGDEPASPAPASPAAAAPPVEAPAAVPPDPTAVLAASLTETKLAKLIAAEEEILPFTAELVRLSRLPPQTSRPSPDELSPDERRRRAEAGVAEVLRKHGLAPADHAGFEGLVAGVLRDVKADEARATLEANVEKKKAFEKRDAAESRKRRDPNLPPWWVEAKDAPPAPLPELYEKQLRVQVEQAEADRRAFLERHGGAVQDLLDRSRASIVALREKQVKVIVGAR